MAIRNIREKGDPLLRKRSREVDNITDRLLDIISDMKETMYQANGLGIAAPQVGILRRMIVIDMRDGEGARVMINPKLVSKSKDTNLDVEGCLSVPNRSGYVERASSVTVEYLDAKGEKQTLDAQDYFARCIQHEIDHLDGVLYTDKTVELTDEEIEELELKKETKKRECV